MVQAQTVSPRLRSSMYYLSTYLGLLAPLPIPSHAWHTVTLDFIEGLPKSVGYNCILVVVNKFSKYAHFVALSHPFTALQVAVIYLNHIFKLHAWPSNHYGF